MSLTADRFGEIIPLREGETYKEVRKIQVTGRSTFILSLPKSWMKEMRIDPGDQVTLLHEPSSNIVSMVSRSDKPSILFPEAASMSISAKEDPETLKRKIVAMYLAGYTMINLTVNSGRIGASLREAVRDLVRRSLIGTEIIADSSGEITLQVLMSLPELSVRTALRRMHLIATSMHKDAITALTEGNKDLAKEVVRSDDEVDRFSLYISRNLVVALRDRQVLKEISLRDGSDALSYRIAAKSVERIGDHAARIAEKSLEIPAVSADLQEKIRIMSELALSVLHDSVQALLENDYELADKTISRSGTIYSLEHAPLSFIQKNNLPHAYAMGLILEDIRRTAEYANDIAEIAINQTIGERIGKGSVTRELAKWRDDKHLE
jgi:phosphate uptake regulator